MVFASPFNGLAASGCSNVPCLRWGGGHTNRKSRCQNLHRSHLNSITAVLLHVLLFTHTHTLIVVTLFFLDAHFFCGKLMFDIVHDVGTFAGRATTRHGQSESYTSTVNKSTFHFPLCPATQLVLMCCVFLDVRTGV